MTSHPAHSETSDDLGMAMARLIVEARQMTAHDQVVYSKGVEDAVSMMVASAMIMHRDFGGRSQDHHVIYDGLVKMTTSAADFVRKIIPEHFR